MMNKQHFLYLYWIDDTKWGGGHFKIGYSMRPYSRYKVESPSSHPIRTIPLGYLDASRARIEENQLKMFMQRMVEGWSEQDGFDIRDVMITKERFRIPGNRQMETIRIFNELADKRRELSKSR
jgi:hypothetical protein